MTHEHCYDDKGCYIGTEMERAIVLWHCDLGEFDIGDKIMKLFDEYEDAANEDDEHKINYSIHTTFDKAVKMAMN